MRTLVFLLSSAAAVSLGAAVPFAQTPRAITAADYQHAEQFLAGYTAPLVLRAGVRANWLPDGRFWYRVTTDSGSETVLVDPREGHQESLRRSPSAPPPRTPDADGGGRGGHGGATPAIALARRQAQPSFISDWNLWVRDIATGQETQLTTDGVKDFGYATDNAGWTQATAPIAASGRPTRRRSRPSSRISARSARCISSSTAGRPSEARGVEVSAARRRDVAMIQRVDHRRRHRRRSSRLQMAPDQHRSTLVRQHRMRGGDWETCSGARTGTQLAFVSTSRDHRKTKRCASPTRRPARCATVFEEKVATYFESGNGRVNWRVPAGDERSDLVLRARQLGPAVSLRSADRQAEEPDHERRRQRHADRCASTRRARTL